eukprot:ANDGO_04503.mRNA.1 Tip elongation aberrant protein 1
MVSRKCTKPVPGSKCPQKRAGQASAAVGHGMWVFGGYPFHGHFRKFLQDMFVYDTLSNIWTEIPAPVAGVQKSQQEKPEVNWPSGRFGHDMVPVLEKHLFMFGGYNEQILNDCWFFDTVLKTWSRFETTGTKPPASYYHRMCAVSLFEVVVFGGYDGRTCFNTLYKLDMRNKVWTTIQVNGVLPAPCGRYKHSLTSFGENLVLFGGSTQNSVQMSDIWLFEAGTSVWHCLSNTRAMISRCPPSREGHCAVRHGNELIITCGTHQDKFCDDIWSVDLSNVTLSGAQSPSDPRSVPMQRSTRSSLNTSLSSETDAATFRSHTSSQLSADDAAHMPAMLHPAFQRYGQTQNGCHFKRPTSAPRASAPVPGSKQLQATNRFSSLRHDGRQGEWIQTTSFSSDSPLLVNQSLGSNTSRTMDPNTSGVRDLLMSLENLAAERKKGMQKTRQGTLHLPTLDSEYSPRDSEQEELHHLSEEFIPPFWIAGDSQHPADQAMPRVVPFEENQSSSTLQSAPPSPSLSAALEPWCTPSCTAMQRWETPQFQQKVFEVMRNFGSRGVPSDLLCASIPAFFPEEANGSLKDDVRMVLSSCSSKRIGALPLFRTRNPDDMHDRRVFYAYTGIFDNDSQ